MWEPSELYSTKHMKHMSQIQNRHIPVASRLLPSSFPNHLCYGLPFFTPLSVSRLGVGISKFDPAAAPGTPLLMFFVPRLNYVGDVEVYTPGSKMLHTPDKYGYILPKKDGLNTPDRYG